MTVWLRRALGVVVAAGLTLAIVGLSWVPWTVEDAESAVLRLAWRYPSQLVEACRPLSAEEQARQLPHMRRTVECARALRPYLLEVAVDGRQVASDSIWARGARADRPLSVFRELRLEPGSRAVRVTFTPYGADGGAPLALETTLVTAPRRVVLVTVGADRRFEVRTAMPPE